VAAASSHNDARSLTPTWAEPLTCSTSCTGDDVGYAVDVDSQNRIVCSQHEPHSKHENRFLHGAACHGCLLISETSCEQHNDFLDRALIVPTVEAFGAEFFQAESL